MKITVYRKPLTTLSADIVRLRFVDGKDALFIETTKGHRELHLGVGEEKSINRRKLILLTRRIIKTAKTHRLKRIAFTFDEILFTDVHKLDHAELASLIAQNFELANYEFTRLKTVPKKGWDLVEEVIVCGVSAKGIQNGFSKGHTIGKELSACRDLSNTPGGDMTPALLAKKAQEACKGTKVKVTILEEQEMKKLGMGAVLGVAQGSSEKPKFIILEYKEGGKTPPVVLAGKGVTFDTGGLNIKPGEGMYEMHMDMSGGAAVVHTLALASKLKLRKNIVGLIPAVENMPSGSSYRPGDVLRSMSGKTIEVLNTDAEGRVILADALTYAKKYKPRLVIDIATLTGASLIALGQYASAIMTRDQEIEDLLRKLGEEAGDYVWPFPLWDEYEDMVKGVFGDVANIPASGNSRYGGVIGGGMFLYQFAKDYPFVHIDMASRMTPAPNEHLAKGATGAPLQLLIKLLEQY